MGRLVLFAGLFFALREKLITTGSQLIDWGLNLTLFLVLFLAGDAVLAHIFKRNQ
jgi:hypothetical protein